MQKFLNIPVLLAFAVTVCGCSRDQGPQDRAVARVNDYTITVKDFNQEIGALKPVFKSVSSIPPAFLRSSVLDDMITRQLLLQEAQRIDIDKDEAFMRQVENFWRMSLIKRLWTLKTNEFASRYSDADPQKIQKVQKDLQDWVYSLKLKAAIVRYYSVLNTIPLDTTEATVNAETE